MKKLIEFVLFAFIFNSILFAQNITENTKKFVKGNIADKTAAVKESTGAEAAELSERGIDFVVKNQPVLGLDRELNSLAVASILALPKEKSSLKQMNGLEQKLVSIFNMFEDTTVRIAVLDKLDSVSDESTGEPGVSLMNGYMMSLKNSDLNEKSPVVEKTIVCLAHSGNSESYKIIYRGWKTGSLKKYNEATEQTLVTLSKTHRTDVTKVISESTISELYNYFRLLKKSDQLSDEFKAEIAENALSVAIYNTEELSGNMTDTVNLQLDSLNTIADANWTRAAKLTVRFFSLAKQEYENHIMSEPNFIQVIKGIAKLSSTDSAQTLSGYLAEMNKNAEKNVIAAQDVVLAVIDSLGALGDKSAFDNLLYVTYLNYPENVKNNARNALAKLRW